MLKYKIINNGKNEWVTFLHGFGGNSAIFKKQLDDFSKYYNLLLIDLHGHGLSKEMSLTLKENIRYESISEDVIEVMDYLNIKETHIIGISLGTLLALNLAQISKNRITSMVLGGCPVKFGIKAQLFIFLGNILKKIIPYSILYNLFAYVLMPKKNHKKSRRIFIKAAVKLGTKEFYAWYNLIKFFNISFSKKKLINIETPKLYISGDQDHMFISYVKEYSNEDENAEFNIINDCGHVCNIDKPHEFNKMAINFLRRHRNRNINNCSYSEIAISCAN